MSEDKKVIVGIDLNNDFIQASYLLEGMEEPESVILGFASQTYHIPADGYKKKDENKWAFGDSGKKFYDEGGYVKVENIIDKVIDGNPVQIEEEQYMPMDILECMFRFVVRECQRVADTEHISKISVCVGQFSKKLLDSIKAVLERMSFSDEDILLLNKTECFIYYSLNAKEELYQRGVALFDFSGKRLTYSYMNYANLEGKTIVMVDTRKEKIISDHAEEVDRELSTLATKVMGNSSMSSVYLTGYGFEKYDSLSQFIQSACNRKRAFIGQNLYAKGAVQGAYEYFYGGNYNNRILACEDRILADFDIDIVERDKEKVYRAIKVGTNWYMAGKQLRFIVNDTNELKIHIKPIEKKPDQEIVISLEDFPKRPDKMTKLMLEIDFSSASVCRLALKDMGFGDYYKTTGKAIFRDIKL